MVKLRPEINEPKYYVHIVIIAIIVLFILKYVFNYDMLNFEFIWKISIAIIIGDLFAHTILKLE